ncbi:uncharacterized protein LOC124856154 [Girardinichthys multiradiatus]|uniref:uncharacterized protein LOC124856154 n=1 Tax=Girardinichthys multiradiatus TaxID=208333 RepID=UPI001FAB871F|nr:uncharacterized protein LOC124856154 [Girardinichthys multiradiatus]
MKTFTGTELLWTSDQSQPAVVEVKCFYTVKYGDVNSQSPHSDISYISVGPKPQMNVRQFEEHYVFICSLPGSVKYDTACSLYFGESSVSTITTPTWKNKNENNELFCQFSASEDNLLRWLHLVQLKVASCDYKLKGDRTISSPQSDPYNLTDVVVADENESTKINIIQPSTMNTDIISIDEKVSNKINVMPTTSMRTTGDFPSTPHL